MILPGFVILIALIAVGCGTTSITVMPAMENTPPPSTPTTAGRIDVGGYKLRYQCFGEGTPATIVEAGGGDKPTISLTWNTVIQNVYPVTRICIYDRADGVRTSQDVAEDLHVLLSEIPVQGPYILVAHSIGGYHARVFAHLYPAEIAGMILVDTTPTYPDANIAFATAYPTHSSNEAPGIANGRISEADIYAIMPPSIDGLDFIASAKQVQQAGSLGNIPLVVISQTPGGPDDWPGLDTATREQYSAITLKIQADLATLSSKGVFMIAKTSNHLISVHEPQIIIDAITQMVEEIRNH
jgi:pimeloyl-ACP methyl ester carboxylesterase